MTMPDDSDSEAPSSLEKRLTLGDSVMTGDVFL